MLTIRVNSFVSTYLQLEMNETFIQYSLFRNSAKAVHPYNVHELASYIHLSIPKCFH